MGGINILITLPNKNTLFDKVYASRADEAFLNSVFDGSAEQDKEWPVKKIKEVYVSNDVVEKAPNFVVAHENLDSFHKELLELFME